MLGTTNVQHAPRNGDPYARAVMIESAVLAKEGLSLIAKRLPVSNAVHTMRIVPHVLEKSAQSVLHAGINFWANALQHNGSVKRIDPFKKIAWNIKIL